MPDLIRPPQVLYLLSFSYPEYADAVTKQYNKNHGLPATQNDADTVFSVNNNYLPAPPQTVDTMYSTLQLDANGNGDAGNAGLDINYANLIYQSRFALVRKWKEEQWRGYEYDIHGFKRYLPYPITQEYQMLYIPQVLVP